MTTYLGQLFANLVAYLPTLLAAIAVLVIGWLIALVVASLVRSLLRRMHLDERIHNTVRGDEAPQQERIPLEKWISSGIFWLIIFITIVIFLQLLNLTVVSTPLSLLLAQILGFIPGLIGALILLLIAWLVATFLRMLVTRVLTGSGFARRLSTDAQVKTPDRVTLGQTLGNVVYWLVFLLFLPAILGALNLQGLLAPVQRVVDQILSVLPNILAAAVIFAVGLLIARIVRQLVASLLEGIGVNRIGSRAGVGTAGQTRLSDVIATIVFVLILIPVAIAALNALNMPAISVPASNMLNSLLNALPALFGAFLLIAIAYFAARIVGQIVTTILSGIGFDRLFTRFGIYRVAPVVPPPASAEVGTPAPAASQARLTPSAIVGYLVTVAIILFAVMEAADLLGFRFLAGILSSFIVAAGQVLIGLIIFGIGLYLADLADRVIRGSEASQAGILAPAARAAIIIFSAALALRQMGIAQDIVNLAFGLLLGAVAVAVALAFGLGGRDVAARQLERWQQSLRAAQAREDRTPGSSSPDITEPPTGPVL